MRERVLIGRVPGLRLSGDVRVALVAAELAHQGSSHATQPALGRACQSGRCYMRLARADWALATSRRGQDACGDEYAVEAASDRLGAGRSSGAFSGVPANVGDEPHGLLQS